MLFGNNSRNILSNKSPLFSSNQIKDIKKSFSSENSEIEIIPISDKIEDYKSPNEDFICEESQDFANEIMCVICQSLVKDPTSCKNCQNLFCKKCIQDWISKNNKCPMRCARFEYMEVPKSTKNVINNIKFKCVKYQIGCKEIVTYETHEKHLKKCNFIKYKCVNCQFTSNYEVALEHSKNCSYSFTECKFCEMKAKTKIFNQSHNELICYKDSGNILIFNNFF